MPSELTRFAQGTVSAATRTGAGPVPGNPSDVQVRGPPAAESIYRFGVGANTNNNAKNDKYPKTPGPITAR